MSSIVRNWIIHLRLPFQLLLAPLFLWAMALGAGQLSARTLLAFVAFHLFGYGGGTAFNSSYDRDEGPIGGLERPPPVPPSLLTFSLWMLAIGQLLAVIVGPAFATLYCAMFILSTLYSHPSVRLKAHPWGALVTVVVGQGFGGFLGGWLAGGSALHDMGSVAAIGGLVTSALITLGFYPLTQLYQIEEDRRRGDRTPAVAWGAEVCFRIATVCFLLGAVGVGALVTWRFTLAEGAIAACFLCGLAGAVQAWRRRFFTSSVHENYHWLMRINAGGAAAFGAYLLLRLAAARVHG